MAAYNEVRQAAIELASYEGTWDNDMPSGKGVMCDPLGVFICMYTCMYVCMYMKALGITTCPAARA